MKIVSNNIQMGMQNLASVREKATKVANVIHENVKASNISMGKDSRRILSNTISALNGEYMAKLAEKNSKIKNFEEIEHSFKYYGAY